jgi:hypothetical protein
MANNAKLLAYTITAPLRDNAPPAIRIGSGWPNNTETTLYPASYPNNSYWIVILSAQNPTQKIVDWVLPAASAAPPAGIETYMENPAYIFAVVTNGLRTVNVPLDAFYNFLAKYGAGTELQKLEQLHSVFGYTVFARAGYILTGPCGPRTPVAPQSYEVGAFNNFNAQTLLPAILLMSLQSLPTGQPPYGIVDAHTWLPRPPAGMRGEEGEH